MGWVTDEFERRRNFRSDDEGANIGELHRTESGPAVRSAWEGLVATIQGDVAEFNSISGRHARTVLTGETLKLFLSDDLDPLLELELHLASSSVTYLLRRSGRREAQVINTLAILCAADECAFVDPDDMTAFGGGFTVRSLSRYLLSHVLF